MKLYSDNLSINAQVVKLFARHPNAPQVKWQGVTYYRNQIACGVTEGRKLYETLAADGLGDVFSWAPNELRDAM